MSNICYKCSQTINKDASYGLHTKCFTSWFKLDEVSEFSDIVRHAATSPSSNSVDPRSYWNSSFFQGKFKKYSAHLAGYEYIIKVQESLTPELPHVEYLCNQIATNIGLDVPPYYLIDFFEMPCFVSKNFVTHLSQAHTLDHIYHFVSKNGGYTCERLIKVIESVAPNISNVEQFIEICLYDALIGNHDRHGRNLGLLRSSKTTQLAPAYDNTSALGLEQGNMLKAQFNPRGKIATKATTEPTMKDYVKVFCDLGFKNNVFRFFKKIDIYDLEQLIKNSFCSDLMKQAMNKLINNRYQELRDAL